jgi:TRAP-type mannitol/chloroaromatic compound transport system permease small subunit
VVLIDSAEESRFEIISAFNAKVRYLWNAKSAAWLET